VPEAKPPEDEAPAAPQLRLYVPPQHGMTEKGNGAIVTALELMARAEKAESALATARGTLKAHADENLSLHARVSELEEEKRSLSAALDDLQADKAAAEVLIDKLEAELRDAQATADKWIEAHGELTIRAARKREELEAALVQARPLKLRHDAENAVLAACRMAQIVTTAPDEFLSEASEREIREAIIAWRLAERGHV